jgi:hypothetical protein
MINFLLQHQFWIAVVLYWIFSAAISAMPEPKPNGSPGYLWLYRFLHTTAGNITTAFGNRIPGIKPFILLLLIPIVFSTTACAVHYTVHPGALNTGDSAAYDALRIAESVIDQARVENQTRPLPTDVKDALNVLVQSYNVARVSWLTYRGAIAANLPSDAYFAQLTENLLDLTNAIRELKGKAVKE